MLVFHQNLTAILRSIDNSKNTEQCTSMFEEPGRKILGL